MTTQEIYNLANTMTQETFNTSVDSLNETQIKTFNSLVRLGDSKELALATVLGQKTYENKEFYRNAYEN